MPLIISVSAEFGQWRAPETVFFFTVLSPCCSNSQGNIHSNHILLYDNMQHSTAVVFKLGSGGHQGSLCVLCFFQKL